MATSIFVYCFVTCILFALSKAATNCTTNADQITCYVQENVADGTLVYDVKEDARYNDSNIFQYVLVGGDPTAEFFNEHFAVNSGSFNGELRTRGDFDREQMFEAVGGATFGRNPIILNVYLRFTNRQTRTHSDVVLHVNVIDINDNTPTFNVASGHEFGKVSEGIIPIFVFISSAEDNDERHNAITNYTLLNDYDGLFVLTFRLNAGGDIVRLQNTRALDRENRSTYDFVVIAVDGDNKTGTLNVTVQVRDVNDNDPMVEMTSYSVSVMENSSMPNQPIIDINATDLDAGDFGRLTYFLDVSSNTGVNLDDVFMINSTSGEISTVRALDREGIPNYHLTVRVVDGGEGPRSAIVTVQVDVVDINDNPPRVTVNLNELVNGMVSEDFMLGGSVGTLTVSDPDEGDNGNFTVGALIDLDQDDDGSQPQIELQRGSQPNTWDLVVARSLDREERDQYSLSITVSDHGTLPLNTTAIISFAVFDENDNSPLFNSSSYSVALSENITVNDLVLDLVAYDLDIGSNADLRYSLGTTSDEFPHQDMFTIHPITGGLTVARSLDRESTPELDVEVIVSDSGEEPRSTPTSVHVVLIDVNDNQPMFLPVVATQVAIPENSPATQVYNFSATDPDLPPYANVTYLIVQDSDAFRIDPMNGTLYTTRELDREGTPFHHLQIGASDMLLEPRYMNFTVVVEDENDVTPMFDGLMYRATVPENATINTVVTNLVVSDPDLNNELQYTIVSGNSEGKFSVNRNGDVIVVSSLDRETTDSYMLVVEVTDGVHTAPDRAEVIITVSDINDHVPQFNQSSYTFFVREESPFAVDVGTVVAISDDAGENGVVSYEITLGNSDGFFIINTNNGTITTRQGIDRELNEMFELTVLAQDGGNPPLFNHSNVTVLVIDINDNNPVFNPANVTRSLREDHSLMHPFYSATATDADEGDNAVVVYSILSSTYGNFSIDPNTGAVSLVSTLNYEAATSVLVVIRATDNTQSQFSSLLYLNISVEDIDDRLPRFPQTFPTLLTINESAPLRHVIYSFQVITSSTSPASHFGYSLSGHGDGFNLLVSNSVASIEVVSLDREEIDEYNLNITIVNNVANLSNYKLLTVVISDANDNYPVFSMERYSFEVMENMTATEVGTVMAEDDDDGINAMIRYAFQEASNLFQIDSTTGQIQTVTSLDYESVQDYTLVVWASDMGNPSKSTSVSMTISVLDKNDNRPQFVANQVYEFSVKESVDIGSIIGTVHATDMDSGDFSVVMYSILSGNSGNWFDINTVDGRGVLSVVSPLNYETMSKHLLVISATDNGQPFNHVQDTFNVTVLDVNDNSPMFIDSQARSVVVDENTGTGYLIATFSANDADSGMNAIVNYMLGSGNYQDTFEIDPLEGELLLVLPLDYEANSYYPLEVIAKDLGSPSRSSVLMFNVTVGNVNDHTPQFDLDEYEVNLREDARLSTIVRVHAVDDDAGVEGEVMYRLMTQFPANDFTINSDSGNIRLSRALNYERYSEYFLQVEAIDKDRIVNDRRTSIATVHVVVENVNDNPPSLLNLPQTIRLSELVSADTIVYVVSAIDLDIDTLQYSITGGNDDDKFTVNSQTGEVFVSSTLDRDVVASYHLTLSITDGLTPVTSLLNVVIDDVNDNIPTFSMSPYVVNVSEGASAGDVVGRIIATDADEGFNSLLEYSLVEPSEYFSVGKSSGNLTLLVPVDRDNYTTTPVITLRVTVTDMGLLYRNSRTTTVNIAITDVNDSPPVFVRAMFTFTIPRNLSRGVTFANISATDADEGINAEHSFQIVESPSGLNLFNLNSTTGELSLTEALGMGSLPFYRIRVRAADLRNQELFDFATVEIIVTDANDHPPLFPNEMYSISLMESVMPPLAILIVNATDEDIGQNGNIMYMFAEAQSHFTINVSTGEITLTDSLDHESTPFYALSVYAVNSNGRNSSATVNVIVEDVNDNKPQFLDVPSSLTISEVPHVGLEVLHIVATDSDSGSYGDITYRQISESAMNQFSIDNITGVVTNLVELVAGTTHMLEFEATDGGGNNSRASVTVTVANLSAQSPDFGRDRASVMVPEDYAVNAVVSQFNASGHLSSPVWYRVSNFPSNVFSLNETTGEIVLIHSLDFEHTQSYQFVVEAFQLESGTQYSSFLEVMILVTDINDNTPVFSRPYIAAMNISESFPFNDLVETIRAVDDDSDENGRVNYAITGGNEGEVFSIGPTDGRIVVVQHLDRESVSAYRLVVTATDEGSPPRSASAVVTVGILDDNDVTPSFRNASYIFRVNENATSRSVIGVVSAVDPDLTPAQLRYIPSSLTASSGGVTVQGIPLTHFQVNQSSGVILLNHDLDRESIDRFELKVNVTDGIKTNSVNVSILVEDFNDNMPLFSNPSLSVSIPELSAIGTSVFQITARDVDLGLNGIVRYRLENDWPSGQFAIDPHTGIVTLTRPAPLYQSETNGAWLSGTVIAHDLGSVPQSSSATVTISLVDVNNHSPSLSPTYSTSIFDNLVPRMSVLTITSDDQDYGNNAEISYYISNLQGPVSIPFKVDRSTGEITVSGDITPGRVVFMVTAINENPDPFASRFILSNTTTVEITVNRINDYSPQFNQSEYTAVVLESSNTNTEVLQVIAIDDDEDTTISYTVQSPESPPFSINANGVISVSGVLDRETVDSYDIVIVATDNGTPRRSSSARVLISISDVNDNRPVFNDVLFETSVMENVRVGAEVTTITATDADLPENAQINYALNDTTAFTINSTSGRIATKIEIDRELVAVYYLQISASDNGGAPSEHSVAVIHVSVNGENEFSPTFNTTNTANFEVTNGQGLGDVVGRLYAFDKDKGSEGELKFTFISYSGPINPNEYFYINSSGFILLNATSQDPSSGRRKRQTDDDDEAKFIVTIDTTVMVQDTGADPQSDEIDIMLAIPKSFIRQALSEEPSPASFPIVVVIAAVVGGIVAAVIMFIIICVCYRWRRRGKNKLYSPTITVTESATRPVGSERVSIVSFTPSHMNGIAHTDARTETAGTRLAVVPEAGHVQISTTSDSEPASGIFGDDESESVSGMQSRMRVNNSEHVSPNGRHRSPQHPRPPPISRSTSDLAAVAMVNGHGSNTFLRRQDDEEAHPYTRDQLIAIYAANANLLTNSPSQDSIHMFGSEGGGEADGDIDMDNYMFAKFAGGLDSADEESVVGLNNDAYTVSSRGRSSIASRSSGGGIDEGPVDLWRGSRTSGFRPNLVTDVIDELQTSLSKENLSQSKEKRKSKPLPHMMQFQETSFTKKPSGGSYTRHTGSMQNVRYPDHVGNSQYEYDGRRSSKSQYASSGALYPLSYSSRASELTLPPYRPGEAPPPYGTELSPPIRPVKPPEMRPDSQSSDSDSSEYPAHNPSVATYAPQPISPQPSLPTTNSTISLDNPIFHPQFYSKHYKAAKSAIPHPHSGSVPQVYGNGIIRGHSLGQGMDRQPRYNASSGNRQL